MSISQNPMTGQMKKSMANFSTYTLNGQNIIRSKSFNRKDANSAAQQAHRSGFKLIVDEYKALGGIVAIGFPNRPETQTPYNAFMAANLPEAIDTSGAEPVIDYAKMIVADGSYTGVIVEKAVVAEAGITVTYKSQIAIRNAEATDKVVALAKTTDGAVYLTEGVRGNIAAGEITIGCPDVTKGDIVYVYLFVASPDGKKVSRSVYVPVV